MEKALANMALKTAEAACSKDGESSKPVKPAATPTQTPTALRGVSQSLLERVSLLISILCMTTMQFNKVNWG